MSEKKSEIEKKNPKGELLEGKSECQEETKVPIKKSEKEKQVPKKPEKKEIGEILSLKKNVEKEEDDRNGDRVSLSKTLYENLVPKENEEEMLASFDKWERALYDEIHVTSYDAGFTWPTSMLMSQILRWGNEAETEEDLCRMLHWNREFDLYSVCKPYLKEILSWGKEAWSE